MDGSDSLIVHEQTHTYAWTRTNKELKGAHATRLLSPQVQHNHLKVTENVNLPTDAQACIHKTQTIAD